MLWPPRAFRAAMTGLFFALCTLAWVVGCAPAGRPAGSPEKPPVAVHLARHSPITLTYQGVAGWQFTAGSTTLLVDPYFSRPDLESEAPISSDLAAVRAHAPARAAAILIGHSHADHVLDAPAVARLTGAEIVGSESTAHYASAAGVPANQIITVKGGGDFEFPSFSLRVIPSLHSALEGKHRFGANQLIPSDVTLPLRFTDFVEGGTFAYLVRSAGHEVLFLDTANFIERELEGIHPDVAVVATGLRHEIHDYSCRLMRVLGSPPLVFANHFDDWRRTPVPTAQLSPEIQADLARFRAEIRACSPHTRLIVPEPFSPNVVE
jgi:L-ascorbate metabolism protein UlaG (beta-lactamase superfamily)